MEIIFELIIGLILEVIVQVIIEVLVFFGYESLASSFKEYKSANKYLAIIGCLLLGAVFGLTTYFIYPHPIIKKSLFPGISLIVSPLIVGLVMKKLGDVRIKSSKRISILLTFRGGSCICIYLCISSFFTY